jgi:3-deoxy-manno-octulosonate cytidylyltransferase (CMP-KDO synthetase)
VSGPLPSSYVVVIPARYASSRFPGKALADLGGRSVLLRCVEQVRKAVPNDSILVATDDERIVAECEQHAVNWRLTSSSCLTGTDRVAEVAQRSNTEWFINVQGDEPFLDPVGLRSLLAAVSQADIGVGVINAYATISTEADFRSSTIPKVVVDQYGRLLYISRSAIPTGKSLEFSSAKRQIGMYAFRKNALELFSGKTSKTPLEHIEDIEILRFLELGVSVKMIQVESVGIAIDTPEDLARARQYLANC